VTRAQAARRLIWLTLFAVAMANLESVIVVYLRELFYADDPLRIFPMRLLPPPVLAIEMGREAATMLMLVAVALLVESQRQRRFAVFLYLFGVWDLLYYIWLEVMLGWPVAWLEWDVLYLIPWVWLGPWICPAAVAALFAAWGARALAAAGPLRWRRWGKTVFVVGALLVLASFLQPAASVLVEAGVNGLEGYVPGRFAWPVFTAGWALMAASLPWVRRFSAFLL